VCTAHRGWLGVVTGISADSTGAVLVSSIIVHILNDDIEPTFRSWLAIPVNDRMLSTSR